MSREHARMQKKTWKQKYNKKQNGKKKVGPFRYFAYSNIINMTKYMK